ncbi:HalD/BesD family halogenase [Aestuariivirga sp.]|uniref:HalD/BesD family halogenase n=1 Tax=Aestuariivirga sp. TaxID=2650926 RepID=UPI003BAC54B5
MRHILDLDRYPLDRPGSPEWHALVARCRSDLAKDGMFNLEGFVKANALAQAKAEIGPVMETLSFTHKRRHNIYFRKEIPGLPADHPALALCETVNHTVCADQISHSVPVWIYEWSHFITFLAAAMNKDALFPARDDLARVNVMAYRDGEALNWHFDRSEFTTTLLLQAPDGGGEFIYRTDLRSEDDPNYDGVAKLLRGEDPEVKSLTLSAGTLNVFRGKNTAHKVGTVKGARERLIAVFSYFDRPGVVFSREDQLGFYGRTA